MKVADGSLAVKQGLDGIDHATATAHVTEHIVSGCEPKRQPRLLAGLIVEIKGVLTHGIVFQGCLVKLVDLRFAEETFQYEIPIAVIVFDLLWIQLSREHNGLLKLPR